MRRIIALCLLAVATCGQAADTVLFFGPDGQQMRPGKYWSVTIHADGTQPSIAMVLDVGGTVPFPPPPPPVPSDVTAKITGYLAAVVDADKAATQAKLAKGYQATIAFVESGTITDLAALKTIQQKVDEALVSKRASAWKSWTDGMTALVASMDFTNTLAAYKIAQGLLGGGPAPPPPPVTTAAKVLILFETENQKPKQAGLLNQMRNEPTWSKLIEVLDPNLKTEKGTPDQLAQAAVKACGNNPLPRVLLLDAAGSFVGDSLPLPETWDALKATLMGLGVKP